MKLTELFTEERAVSPVLGVALLIAITVILAGVVGFVVLGVDTQGTDSPQTQLNFQQAGASGSITVDVVHDGGDPIDDATVDVRVNDAGGSTTIAADQLGNDLRTGDSAQVANTGEEGDTVRLVWEDPDSDREVLIAEYTVEAP